MGRIVTTSSDLQLDPPEAAVLQSLSAQLIFLKKNILSCGLFEGVLRTTVEEILDKGLKGEVRLG